mgnify:CR=1 FL=1
MRLAQRGLLGGLAVVDPALGGRRLAVDFDRAIDIAALPDEARGVVEGRALAALLPGLAARAEVPKEFWDKFDVADKNKDGAITPDEVKGTPMESFFRAQDLNGDGKITKWMPSQMAAGSNTSADAARKFNVGTALYEMLGDRYICARAFAHPTRRALSRMMDLS